MNLEKSRFYNQADLMIRCLPSVFEEKCFALKGGTAINFYYRELPRLSVDIDLVYLPIQDFSESMTSISDALKRISTRIHGQIRDVKVHHSEKHGIIQKLSVRATGTNVTIEPNFVIRGALDTTEEKDLKPAVQSLFKKSAKMRLISFEEIYAGKLCAAFDRQHPRDFFDVRMLLAEKGISTRMKELFLAYVSSSDRPIHEILFPSLKDLSEPYANDFEEMTATEVSLKQLEQSRLEMIQVIHQLLSNDDKEFLLSVVRGEPNFKLVGIPNLNSFPSLLWKVANLKKLQTSNPKKFAQQSTDLKNKFDQI